MARGRLREEWRHTSHLLATLMTINTPKNKVIKTQDMNFNPLQRQEKGEKPPKVDVKRLKGIFGGGDDE